MNVSLAYPVQVLRKHITELEAAITVCLADPGVRPVHKLRTETRRVEALLLLLALVPELPEHRKQAATLTRSLRKLRRAAGEVRDLDVHRMMLEAFAEAETDVVEGARGESQNQSSERREGGSEAAGDRKATRRRSAVAESVDPAPSAPAAAAGALSRSAEDLRRRMGRERAKAVAALQHVLKAREAKTARSGEALLGILKPAEALPLPGPDLLRDAESVLSRNGLLKENVQKLSRVELHEVRKAAKASRYIAESLPADKAVAGAAREFEALQEAGGQWHDAWQLARAARRRFGKEHELTALYREERDRKLESYRAALQERAAMASQNSALTMKKARLPPGAGRKRAAAEGAKPSEQQTAA